MQGVQAGTGRREVQPRVTWDGVSESLFQFRVRENSQLWLSSYPIMGIFVFFFSGKDSSKLHLPTNTPSSDVRAQSTSSSVCILLPSWKFWRIRGKFPPTLLFQDKFSSSSSGIALSASPVTKWPKDWSLVCKQGVHFKTSPTIIYGEWKLGQVLVRCQGTEKKRTQFPPAPSRGSLVFTGTIYLVPPQVWSYAYV